MENVNWNNVRQAIYVLGAGVLGAAAAMGWISAEQGAQFTSALTETLGAVFMLVAAANVNKGHVVGPAAGPALPSYDFESSGYVGRHRASEDSGH